MKRITACLAALSLAACATPHDKTGPLAPGVRADAPRDTIGVVLSWTPEQTIVNFRRADQIFPAHIIHRGAKVRALPRAAVQIDPVVTRSEGLPAMSVEQLMNAERITGVIAVKDGEIILERYAFGRGPDDKWISMSVAKSVTSTLIGAAVKDGLIHSIDDPVVRYIPELKGTAFEDVTIRHLMTMSSGVRWREDYVDLTSDVALAGGGKMVGGVPPLVAYAKRLEREAKPGTRRKYIPLMPIFWVSCCRERSRAAPSRTTSLRKSGSRSAWNPMPAGSSTRRGSSVAGVVCRLRCATMRA